MACDAVNARANVQTCAAPSPIRNADLLTGSIVALTLAPVLAFAQAAMVNFSHPGGLHESPFSLTLSTIATNGTIYFTTNGSVPTRATALRYRSPLPIAATTIIRAAAFRENAGVTETATRTFAFPAFVPHQTAGTLPRFWGTNHGEPIPAHYTLTYHRADTALAAALRALPSVFLVADREDWFSPTNGIYLHPTGRGSAWERSASVEWFDPGNRETFAVNCGLRIHGGLSRQPEESPKHSFRLLFKRRYGPARLQVPLFGPDEPREFDELVLRAGSNDSWLDSNGAQRRRATYKRDEWKRRSLRELGHPSARGRFVHLYLNGLYWGVYNLCERPDGSLLRTRAASYDIRKGGELESGDAAGWNQLMSLANSSASDAQNFRALSQHLDLTQFADFLLLNFYAGNADWDRSANWYAIRPRTADGQFQFLVWDGERTLEDVATNILDRDEDESPLRFFHKLAEHDAFRRLFAERAERHLFGTGLLSPEASAARFRSLADSLAPALPAEAARWGSYRRDVHPFKTGPYELYTAEDHWRPEVERVLTRFFPARRDALVEQLRERGWFREKR
jgi:hypothetical protein